MDLHWNVFGFPETFQGSPSLHPGNTLELCMCMQNLMSPLNQRHSHVCNLNYRYNVHAAESSSPTGWLQQNDMEDNGTKGISVLSMCTIISAYFLTC